MPSSRYQPTEPDLIKMIRELQQRVAKLERTPQTSNAGVDSTGVNVNEGFVRHVVDDFVGGSHIISSGTFFNGEPAAAVSLTRAESVVSDYTLSDGTPETALPAYQIGSTEGTDPDFKFPTVLIYDKSGDPLITDSNNARRGFGDPVLGIPWNDKVLSSTTSGTMADIAQFTWYQYHAHCLISIVSSNDATTTGTVQVQEETSGIIVASITTPANTTQYNDLVIKRSSLTNGRDPNGTPTILNVQHARATGAGTVRSRVASIVGIDLSLFQDF